MDVHDYVALFKPDSKQLQTFRVLQDQQWHCRNCAYRHIASGQIAGSGGIQGLRRGSSTRPGITLEHEHRACPECGQRTRHDRWTGAFTSLFHMAGIPLAVTQRAYRVLGRRDVVENVARSINELTLDHKLPMKRWNEVTSQQQTDYAALTAADIRTRFQLLKKSNGAVSHNHLKSRACETCYETGRRGTPFGIHYFYAGSAWWEGRSQDDPQGCIGCGWYDFAAWRRSLNRQLQG